MRTRQDWISAGLEALATGGERAIRVDPLATALGVTKGSFHHHFRGAADLRRAVLGAHERHELEVVAAVRAEVHGIDPSAALDHLGALVGRAPDHRLDRAVRAWAAVDEAAAEAQARIDAARLDAIQSLWRQIVPEPHARTAALVPLLTLIGASASTVATSAELEAVLRMLARLAHHIPAIVDEG